MVKIDVYDSMLMSVEVCMWFFITGRKHSDPDAAKKPLISDVCICGLHAVPHMLCPISGNRLPCHHLKILVLELQMVTVKKTQSLLA